MKSSCRNFMLGMIAGSAIGAAIGILYAPDKGTETRKKIKVKADDLKDDLETKYNDLKEQVDEVIDKVKETFKSAAEEVEKKEVANNSGRGKPKKKA